MSEIFPRASRLGFGCASLGSRVARDKSIAALELAFERGVNWFDLAPSYGDGDAERIFAAFARGRRSQIHICTKCGLEPPPVSTVRKLIKPLARSVVAMVPNLRRLVARGREGAQAIPLSAESIGESLHRSLERLGTDFVDVLALHEPAVGDVSRDEILEALYQLVRAGKVRAVGVAGALELSKAALASGLPWTHLQFPSGPLSGSMAQLRAVSAEVDALSVATFSVFGEMPALKQGQATNSIAAASGYDMPLPQAWRAAALDRALRDNSKGTVLVSMFAPSHLDFAVSRLDRFSTSTPDRLFDLVGSESFGA